MWLFGAVDNGRAMFFRDFLGEVILSIFLFVGEQQKEQGGEYFRRKHTFISNLT